MENNKQGIPIPRFLLFIMRMTFFLFVVGVFQAYAVDSYAQKTHMTIRENKIELGKLFDKIEKQSDFYFFYSNNKINKKQVVSVDVENKTIFEILDIVLAESNIDYKVNDKAIVLNVREEIASIANTQQQGKTITGTVVGNNGEVIIGATIVVQGDASRGTVTDVDGKFVLSNIPNDAIVEVSYVGMKTQLINTSGKTSIDVVMVEDVELLDELVVVGYGVQKKVNLTGSVATVNAEEIEDTPASSLSSALAGKIAGVLMTQSGGKPGAGSSMTVRAQGTWNNTDPLYVIDGVVRDKFVFDGLNASEVENLSVLKDGASAAIYGARAANGVVLVTTKKGKIGKPVISYTGSIGISDATKIPETQNAYNQAIFINDNLMVEGVDPSDARYYTSDELEYYKNNNHDWMGEAWKQPIVTRHSVNVGGGNDRVRYFVGGSYFYETGSFENLSFNKYNLRSNIEANITKDLVASLNISTDSRNDNKPYWRYDYDSDKMADLYKGVLFKTGQVAPYIDGKANGTFVEWHPLEVLADHTGYNRKRYSNNEASISLQYDTPFLEGLSLKILYNKYSRHTFVKQFNRPYTLYEFKMTGGHNHIPTNEIDNVKVRNDGDFLYEKYDNQETYQFNAFATYANTFGKHDVGGLFVYEQSEGTVDWFDGQRNFFISSAIDQLFAGSSDSKNSTLNGNGSETGRISYVGRLNYGYDEKYLVEASFRYDGSVNFAPKNRWGFFPSASAAWRISEESFFKNNIKFIDYLKFRSSVGLLGNDAVGGWQWMQRYNLVDGAYYGSLTSGVSPNVIPNPNITWEKSLTYNGGFDATFLQNKLSLNFDAFYRHTYDILGNRLASLPTTFGANMPAENYAVINAKGLEVELGYSDRIGKDFSYYVKGNIGYATNKLITKDEAENLRPYKSEIGYNTDRRMGYIATGIIRTQAELDALPADFTIFGQKPELGMLNYKDLRGSNSDEPDGVIDDNDQDWIMNHTIPPINYGFSLGANWKGLSLDLFFQGVAGHDVMISMRGAQARPQETNFDFWTDHWTPENVNAQYPRASRNNAGNASSFWIRNGSFLRLKNANLSYSLPQSVISKLGISQLRLFLTGSNLGLLQNNVKYYDPESSSIIDYPMMKSYSFGLNISF